MKYDPRIHHRRSIRLKGYDYSQNGAYFLTICVHNKKCLFGKIVNNEIKLNDAGRMLEEEWSNLAIRFKNIQLDEHVVMPNHFHGIIMVEAPLVGAQDATQVETPPTKSAPAISNMVGAFKSITTCQYIDGVKIRGWPPFKKKLWQQNYYEHIIRNEASLEKIRNYVLGNPSNWSMDELWVE